MPIKINADAKSIAQTAKQFYNPKYFSKDITGSGKVSGMLNQTIFPANLPASVPENRVPKPHWHIRNETNKYVKTNVFPLSPLGSYHAINVLDGVEFDANWCKLPKNILGGEYYFRLMPASVIITESIATAATNTNANAGTNTNANNTAAGKKCSVLYQLAEIKVEDINGEKHCQIVDIIGYSENPVLTVNNSSLTAAEKAAVVNYLSSYDTYNEICKLSKIWQTTLVEEILNAYDKDPMLFPMDRIIRYISQYKVSLQQYNQLYNGLKQRFDPAALKAFTKMNTSLLLQDTLDNLSSIQFPQLPPMGSTNKRLDLSWCSKEQFDAITSAHPLNLVQAGAGTGKSTVIKSRLDYLDYLGVDLNKVMVLSFTNAAADNIQARCPGIQSMTIAKMIDTIYQENHPNHQLSPSFARRGEGSTFTNSLELYKDQLPCVRELIRATDDAERKNDYAQLLRLVEEHYTDIMTILDTIQQTTFHLEIIICYLEHATMRIPFNIEHLLIDEVQDNAIFEFIFFLNLTCKLQNHLYLVGDCSQTLYEFRASDPKALNAIENSQIFATFPLNINYRSNQDILQFANALLDDIEANQYANIRLQSFKLNAVTKQSFTENVIVDYTRLNKVSEMPDHVYRKLHSPEMTKWINDKFAKNEQICILAFKRREATLFQKELEKIYPNRKFTSIIPAKNMSFAYFSKYVSNCRPQLMALPASNVHDVCSRVRSEVITNLGNCGISPTKNPHYTTIVANIQKMLIEWEVKNTDMLNDAIAKFNTGAITHEEYVNIIADSLINFEISKNALKQSLLSQKNANQKENTSDADFIFSTIHSAKGLEFDNVILLYQNKNAMEEDAKRMYYVALTRAKKSEYIIAYDTVLSALISTRYDAVLQRLDDANAASGLMTV